MNNDKATTMLGAGLAATVASTVDVERLIQRDKTEMAKLAYIGLQLLFGWFTNRRAKGN